VNKVGEYKPSVHWALPAAVFAVTMCVGLEIQALYSSAGHPTVKTSS